MEITREKMDNGFCKIIDKDGVRKVALDFLDHNETLTLNGMLGRANINIAVFGNSLDDIHCGINIAGYAKHHMDCTREDNDLIEKFEKLLNENIETLMNYVEII